MHVKMTATTRNVARIVEIRTTATNYGVKLEGWNRAGELVCSAYKAQSQEAEYVAAMQNGYNPQTKQWSE